MYIYIVLDSDGCLDVSLVGSVDPQYFDELVKYDDYKNNLVTNQETEESIVSWQGPGSPEHLYSTLSATRYFHFKTKEILYLRVSIKKQLDSLDTWKAVNATIVQKIMEACSIDDMLVDDSLKSHTVPDDIGSTAHGIWNRLYTAGTEFTYVIGVMDQFINPKNGSDPEAVNVQDLRDIMVSAFNFSKFRDNIHEMQLFVSNVQRYFASESKFMRCVQSIKTGSEQLHERLTWLKARVAPSLS